MHRKFRPRLTYANVVATIALFLALGGATALATGGLPKNSVGSRQLKSKAVTTGKIAGGAVNGSKVAKESLTGEDIKLSQLGRVPLAASSQSAEDAAAVQGHPASCPANTTLIRGACFDSHSNPAVPSLETAAENCAAKGGSLPTPMQLYATRGVLNLGTGANAEQHQYTDVIYSSPGEGHYSTVVVNGNGAPVEQETDVPSAYTCVYPLVH
jgi:hypothetical protein